MGWLLGVVAMGGCYGMGFRDRYSYFRPQRTPARGCSASCQARGLCGSRQAKRVARGGVHSLGGGAADMSLLLQRHEVDEVGDVTHAWALGRLRFESVNGCKLAETDGLGMELLFCIEIS